MTGTNFGQVSCLVAVPAYDFGRHFAIFDGMHSAAAASAFSLEERVGQFSFAWCASWALGPGLATLLVLLAVPCRVSLHSICLLVALHSICLLVALFLASLGPVPALCLLSDELPCNSHTMAA